MNADDRLTCWVYRCARRADTYVYLVREDAFELLPQALRTAVGELQLVMRLELHPRRQLANASVERVLGELRGPGYYLQLPPGHMPFDGPSRARH